MNTLMAIRMRAGLVLWACALLAAVLAVTVQAAAPPAATVAQVAGRWLTEPRDGIIEVTVSPEGALEGRIIGGNHPGRLDAKNPDAAARTKELRGQVILKGMAFEGDSRWSGGTIYDPDSGSTYKCNVALRADGTLKVRGYIGFSLLGKNQVWTRYTGTSLDLPPAR